MSWCASTSSAPRAVARKRCLTCGTCTAASSGKSRRDRPVSPPRRPPRCRAPSEPLSNASKRRRAPELVSVSGRLGVGLLGLGTVGSGVARVLLTKSDTLERRIGRPVEIRKVLVRHPEKPRAVTVPAPIVTDASEVIEDPSIEIVIEVLGGEEPARTLILRAIERGKHVVTANKEVMAKHG